MNNNKKYPEGHFIGIWIGIFMAIFSGIGIPLSIITENSGFIGIGPALGVAVGVAIGQSIENQYKKNGKIRPLTEIEQKRKNNLIFSGIIILTLGLLILILQFFI